MSDIVLIQPPVEDFYFTYKRSIPYGLASIAASLQSHGFSVEIVDCLAVKKSKKIPLPEEMDYLTPYYGNEDICAFSLFHEFRHYGYSFEYAGKIIRDKSPFLVGITSLFTPYCHTADRVARSVKKFHPDCCIVMGGHHPTVLPEAAMGCSAVDFLLRGEGEISMPMLAEYLSPANRRKEGDVIGGKSDKNSYHHSQDASSRLEDVPGIVFRKKDAYHKSVLHISDPVWIEDFDTLPLPDFSLINHRYYSRNHRGSAVVVAGRGCPMPCTYCSVGASSKHGKFRQRQVDEVLDELTIQIEEYGAGFIDFEDENLTLNRKWFMALLEGIKSIRARLKYSAIDTDRNDDDEVENKNTDEAEKKGQKIGKKQRFEKSSEDRPFELRAMNGLYPPSLDREMVFAMKEAGFDTLNLSLGSTSKEQLMRFKRPDVRNAYEKALGFAQELGMATVSYIIAGAPGQCAVDSLEDLIYLASQKTLAGLSIFYPAPGSVDYELCRQKGILPDHFSQMRSSALPLDDTTSRVESVTLMRLARIVNFMKAIMDEKGELPDAKVCPICITKREPTKTKIKLDIGYERFGKQQISTTLLQWFLNDGKIRGVSRENELFEHHISRELTDRFLLRLKSVDVQGSR